MLTTVDNPFNPRTDFEKWLEWDNEHEYYTCQYLARVASPPPDLAEDEEEGYWQAAIDSIIENDFLGIYIVV